VAVSDVKLMGVVNVTPDSFSDGGLYLDPSTAIAHGRELADAGAAILDVGGESTRPGAAPVAAEEEKRRVEPVVAALAGVAEAISVDTSKATVAAAALDAGASIVNDVTALRGDPEMAALVADRGSGLVLMHMAGDPRTMQVDPTYGDVVAEVRDFLAARLEAAVAAGIDESRVWLDRPPQLRTPARHPRAGDPRPPDPPRHLAQVLHRPHRRLRDRRPPRRHDRHLGPRRHRRRLHPPRPRRARDGTSTARGRRSFDRLIRRCVP
jgi:hypothetical protein